MSLVEFFVEPLRYEFMVRALTTTLVTAVVSATLSCWLALIGWSLMGDAVSHAVLPDVVLAYIVGAPFAVGAVVFGLLAVGLIGVVRDTSRIRKTRRSAVIGLYISYHLDTAPGGMVVVVQGVAFTLVYLFALRRGVIGRRITATRRRTAVAA
ncbi:metal ABC transporter permease [Nocardia xishanensis]|uniref:metal ABC transporter permease n=1 Tax=Nocardia xishanensis TaxID=238964 RepID=UPI0033DB9101